MALSYVKVYGPYRNDRGRDFVIVVDRKGKKNTISYPKYLMEMHLGRKLDPNKETVDHWDTDKYNNDIKNLRLVPREEHSADDTRRALPAKLKCSWCDKEFERSARVVRDKHKRGVRGTFCSRSCAGKYARSVQLQLINNDAIDLAPNIQSEYYKRKYGPDVKMSRASIEEIDFDFEDLLVFASEEEDIE